MSDALTTGAERLNLDIYKAGGMLISPRVVIVQDIGIMALVEFAEANRATNAGAAALRTWETGNA